MKKRWKNNNGIWNYCRFCRVRIVRINTAKLQCSTGLLLLLVGHYSFHVQQLNKSIGCDFCDNFPIHRIQIKVNNFGKLCRSIPTVCVALVLLFSNGCTFSANAVFPHWIHLYGFHFNSVSICVFFSRLRFSCRHCFFGVVDAFCNYENLLTWKLGELNTRGIFIPLPKCKKKYQQKNNKKDLVYKQMALLAAS